MKKFLLSLACVAASAMMASAETVTFDVSGDNGYGMTLLSGSTQEYNADGTTLTEGAVTITLNGNTRWWANSKGNQLRFYKDSGLTVTAAGANISKVEFTPHDIKLGGDGFQGGIWTGNAAEVTLNATNTSGNTYCNKITVTYGEGGEGGSAYGKYEAATTFAPGDYLFYSSNKIAVPLMGSYGYLQVQDANITDGAIIAPKNNQFKFVADGEYYNIIDPRGRYVYQTGSYNSFNVADEKPEEGAQWTVTANADGTFSITNVAKQKTIQYDTQYGTFGCYDDERGLKPALYRYVADAFNTEPEPELPVIESLSSLSDFPNNERFKMGVILSVVYANGAYTYVCDKQTHQSFALIYKNGLNLYSGHIIESGWTGKVSIYNGLIELVPDDDSIGCWTGLDDYLPAPLPVETEDAPYVVAAYNQSRYIKLLNVTFDTATPAADVTASADRTYTGKMGDFEVTFFQRFGLESVEPGTYDVTGFIAVYNDLVQVYPIAIETPGGNVEPEIPVVDNLICLGDFPNGEAFEMGVDLSVIYANGSYVYVNDGNTNGLIYKSGLGLEAGNVIAKGWKGKVSIYNGLLELVPDDATLATTGATATLPEPLPVEGEDAQWVVAAYNQSAYLKLLNVVFDAATPAADAAGATRTYTGKMGDFEVTFYQRFGLESVEPGTYDVTGFVAVYNDQVQVYPIAIQAAGAVEPEIPVIENIIVLSDFPNGEAFEMGVDLTVIYANGSYVYVTDGLSNGLIYKNGLGLEAGNVIAKGWKGKVSIYNGLLEMVPEEAALATTGEAGTIPSAMPVTGEDAQWVVAAYNQHAYLMLEEVVFETATPAADAAGAARTYTGKMGDFEVTFYQRFGLDSVEPGTYNVTGFVAVYNDQVQVYPVLIQKSTGISGIANDDADARYYNINGVEVSNPAQGGLYIRVAGGKATKVIK